MRRVVITGMGAVSAAGIGGDALWHAARDGISGVRPIDLPRGEALRVRIAANVPDFDAEALLSAPVPRTAERFAQFAMVAAAEAVAQSGLSADEIGGHRTTAIIGTGIGGANTIDDNSAVFYLGKEAGLRKEPMAVPRIMPSSAASHVSIAHGITGPTFGIVSACASAAQSIGIAAQMIRSGSVDRAVTGGAEASITPISMRGWELLRVLTPRACRPFSAERTGMSIGEGAGILVLEAEDVALARGVQPLAYLAGFGTSSDAKDMIQPDPDGAALAMREALADAGIEPDAVGYVNAHGTGTVLNDTNEAEALRRVFGDGLDRLPVSSSKPVIGHTLGAAGALELMITVQALQNQTIPPQMNFIRPDPKCPLFLPTDGALPASFEVALSNSFAFGGINASLVVSRAN